MSKKKGPRGLRFSHWVTPNLCSGSNVFFSFLLCFSLLTCLRAASRPSRARAALIIMMLCGVALAHHHRITTAAASHAAVPWMFQQLVCCYGNNMHSVLLTSRFSLSHSLLWWWCSERRARRSMMCPFNWIRKWLIIFTGLFSTWKRLIYHF